MSIFRFTTRVSYPDLDQNYNLSMSGALRLMQEAAAIHSDSLGYSFRTVSQTHVHWLVVSWRVRMIRKAGWNETLYVDTWPRTMSRVTSERDFEIKNEAGETICLATSNWILVSSDTGRATRVTPQIASAYPLTPEPAFGDELQLPNVDNGEETYVGRVIRRDLDTNQHVNNLIYLDYARQALPEEVYHHTFREIAVKYSRQLLLGDTFHCIYSHTDGCHVVKLQSETGTLHASVHFLE